MCTHETGAGLAGGVVVLGLSWGCSGEAPSPSSPRTAPAALLNTTADDWQHLSVDVSVTVNWPSDGRVLAAPIQTTYKLSREQVDSGGWRTVIESTPTSGLPEGMKGQVPARLERYDDGRVVVLDGSGRVASIAAARTAWADAPTPAGNTVPYSRPPRNSSASGAGIARPARGRTWADFLVVSAAGKGRLMAGLPSGGALSKAGATHILVSQKHGVVTTEMVIDTARGRVEELRTITPDGSTSRTRHSYFQATPEREFLSRSEHLTLSASGQQVGASVIVTYSNWTMTSSKGGA